VPTIRRPVPYIRRRAILAAAALGLAAGAGAASAAEDDFLETVPGPVTARVLKVRDGDTAEVAAYVWPGQTVYVAVRLHGVDAPEHRGKCTSEKTAAQAAQDRFQALVDAAGGEVTLTAISGDKYFGRVLADMAAAGRDVGRTLLREGHVAPYDGKARRSWCDAGETAQAPARRGTDAAASAPPAPSRRPEPPPRGRVPGFPGYRG
jgi:micrococcal nuclease